jgi:hypothetical protein
MKIKVVKILLNLNMVLLFSCSTNSSKEKKPEKQVLPEKSTITDKNVYDDINLFKLEGVNKISNPTKYPYIKIDSLSPNQKKIVYQVSKNISFERVYLKEDNFWTTSYEYKGDTGYERTYEYITPEKIIELGYYGSYKKENYHLHHASSFEKNKKITYNYWGDKGIVLDPDIHNLDLIKSKVLAITTEKFEIKNGILKILDNTFDKKENQFVYSDTLCYKVREHSVFWWNYFGFGTKIACK